MGGNSAYCKRTLIYVKIFSGRGEGVCMCVCVCVRERERERETETETETETQRERDRERERERERATNLFLCSGRCHRHTVSYCCSDTPPGTAATPDGLGSRRGRGQP